MNANVTPTIAPSPPPSAEFLVIAAKINHVANPTSPATQLNRNKIPTPEATPTPPLNFHHTGQL
jgi:hypothetical protein